MAMTFGLILPRLLFESKGTRAVVGKNFAILESGHLRSSGFVTRWVWAALHVLALPQLQNRFRVQTQWFWSYLSGQTEFTADFRGAPIVRVIVGEAR